MKLLCLEDVTHRTTLSKAGIYRLIAKGDFPKSTRIGVRRVGWLEEEINQWIARMFDAGPSAGDRT